MRRFGLILITYIITAVVAVAWADVDDGLIAYWSFDACNFQDQSGNGFDNGVTPARAPECLSGAEGNALEFAGTDEHYLRIPDVPVAATQHSYAFWFRPATALDANSPRQDLLYADVPIVVSGNGRPHITLNHDDDGKIGFHARIIPTGGSTDDAISYNDIKSDTNTWDADRWYHVAFTWDGEDGQFRVYVDGVLQQTIPKPSGTSQTYTGLVLAIRGDLQFPFQGSLDEIRLYNRVLSDAEVQTLAAFAPGSSFELTVSTDGTGTGTVFSTPTAGIACGTADTDCTQSYASGTSVTLTAVATPDSVFDGWIGGDCSGVETCVVTMTEDVTVTATVERLSTLNIIKTGDGDGSVVSDIPGIDCGEDCSEVYTGETVITLTATPAADSVFTGWSDPDCPGTGPCVVTLPEGRDITATFENPPPVANAGANQTVDEGILVILDGSQSTDLGDTLSYSWVQTGGDLVTLSNTSAVQTTFTSPGVDANGAVLGFELTVTDSRGRSATDRVQVTVLDTNIPPMADAGPDRLVEENTQVTLNGANSSDSDGAIESFVWLQIAGPPVSLSDPTSPQPVFTAPIVSLAAGFLPGDTLPGFVLQHRAAGSIADVAARGAYINGQWTVLFTRALITLDPDADVQFDLSHAANLYGFSIAYLDNTGAAPPRSAAAAVMATQDTAPYTLGNATSGADLQARRETPLDCSAFTGTPLVTTPADPAVVPSLTLQAAYDDLNLYLCVRAPDPNGIADERPEHWEFLGPESTDWERKPNAVNVMGGTPHAFDEDRIALWWNINAQDFATEGCVALCHDQRMQSRNPDGRADLWHWKAGTTNLAGFAQDQGLSADPALCPEHPCRQSDGAAEAIAQPNARRVDTLMLPAFSAADGPGVSARTLFADEVPTECFDCAFAQSAAVFNDLLEFELTVTDDGGLSASDRVTVQIVETGGSDTDADGVSNAVEDQAPNNGDGNHDGVVDRRQPHVTSLPNVDGTYVTLESPSGSVLADVRAIPNPSPGNAPPNTGFPLGFFTFVVQGLTPGDAATVTLYLPAGTAPNTYYKFGPTPDDPSPHWYEFLLGTATGAVLAGDRVILHLQDGQRGDDDLTENGAIMDPGAVAIMTTPPPPPPPVPSGGGGGGGGCAMMPGAQVDPTLLAALSLILAYLSWRRTRQV